MTETLNVTFDEYGFVTDPNQWNREVAESIADDLGIGELREAHWKVLEFYREHYLEHGAMVPMEHICHVLKLDKHCVRQLFKGPEEAWKIAGLPNPGTEARIYMEDEE